MKKAFILIALLLVCNEVYSQVGINTNDPTESLDVNGKMRIRDTPTLSSASANSLYVDENGVIGKSDLTPTPPQITFVSSIETTNVVNNFNAGNTIQLPVTSANLSLNSLNSTILNNSIRIPSAGIYQLTGALNISLSTGAINNRVYLAFNIQRSINNGSTWTSVSGARPVFIMADNTEISYNSVLPQSTVELNENDLLRLVIYRTRLPNGTLQGSNLTVGNITQNIDHGSRSFVLSLSKF
ncbi:hypothetical protein [Chishuiella changwenlii]|jgi:hypothetical protein|uniref:hypothetical protein n=1 Tax=Chishuiella changwenlii TaxID=1434701 RepID=UPI002FDAFE02